MIKKTKLKNILNSDEFYMVNYRSVNCNKNLATLQIIK